ncbi:MAG: Flp pilus assembly complex ATPase component TadA [Candidatus Omnitrophica bacterium]|nr:Flp pilus assembly complex ATPase component TadA [Candidatus Omnitrophota bacterium]
MLPLKERLTEILIKNKLITPQQLEQALETQRGKGGRLSSVIVESGFVKESDLVSALSEGLNLPLIDLKRIKIEAAALNVIPAKICRRYQVIPISQMGNTLTIAMADPLNIFCLDVLHHLTGFKINPIISIAEQITEAIDQFYPDTTSGIIKELLQEISESKIELIQEEKKVQPTDRELGHASRQGPVIRITNLILEDAIKKKASDVLIEPLAESLRIRFRIDGILREQEPSPKSMHPLLVSRIKVLSELDIAEHRLPQDGRFKARIQDRNIDFRVSILPSILGEKVAVRVLDKTTATLDVDKLGFDQASISKIKKAAGFPHGMILVCGPTGSGKTTTLYSILKFVDIPQKNIVTVEDPVEFQLEGINQVSIKPDIGLSFPFALRSILRQDPNVIMIGEIRDFETVDIAIKSALTGHLVLSTLHTTTASGSIVRLINMGVEPYLITSSLICVLAQRLVRRLCPKCKEGYKLPEDVAKNLQIPITVPPLFYRPKGCRHCFNTGYSGRMGIAEVLFPSANIKDLILSQAQEHQIEQTACNEGMKTLRQNALNLAYEGLISLEEVLRVTSA